MRWLAGTQYPANRDELVERATRAAAMLWVLDRLQHLPIDEPFQNAQQIWEAIGGA